jgi:pyruvate/2-oxoglutarate dehydrogenase complex dihydrolipoamide dehydrogenase (E3) component
MPLASAMNDSVAIGRMIDEGGPVGLRGAERATPSDQGHAARPPHVVIVGGGSGSLNTARALASHPVRITVLDRQNYHCILAIRSGSASRQG